MEIIIRGEQGEGKTLLGIALTDLLKKQGLKAVYESKMPCTDRVSKNLINQFKDKTITIKTEQQ